MTGGHSSSGSGLAAMRGAESGMVLGKFLPPHLGHTYLVEFARRYVDDLTVVVGTLAAEPIPGELRYRWMSEMFPDCRVVHLTDENPQDPSEHPDFWRIWRESLLRVLPRPPDLVFASEDYGRRLAQELGARFVPVDRARKTVPVSGTAIRSAPLAHWQYLPACVRAHYARRVVIFGPESTGKTTLARALAERFDTVWVPEYARSLLEAQDDQVGPDDIPRIARGQIAAEDVMARRANRVLISDTDVLLTKIWSEVLFGGCPDWIAEEGRRRRCDLTLLTDVDVPWVADPVRYLPNERTSFLERCVGELEASGRKYVRLSGSFDQRFEEACRQVEALLV